VVHAEQAQWIADLENFSDFHDAQRFQFPASYLETYYHGKITGWRRCLDYILASYKSLERAEDIRCIPSSGSDHELLVMEINLGDEKVQGPGMWKVNKNLLKDDEYCTLVKSVISDAKKSASSADATVVWEFTKFRIPEESIKFSKRRASEKQEAGGQKKVRRKICGAAQKQHSC
jgi:hypothetical protein